MSLQKWWKARKEKKKQEQHDVGFDYALGAIARGEKTPLELDAEHVEIMWTSFDIGMDEAIDYAILHELVKDNRF